jgi:hypothetical protein
MMRLFSAMTTKRKGAGCKFEPIENGSAELTVTRKKPD